MDPLPKEVPKWKQRLGSPAEAAKERLPLRKKPSRPTKPATLSQTMEKKEQNDELSVKTDHLEEVFNSAPASATGFNSELDSPERTIKNNPRRTSVLAADVPIGSTDWDALRDIMTPQQVVSSTVSATLSPLTSTSLRQRTEDLEFALVDLAAREESLRKMTRGLAVMHSSLKAKVGFLVPKLEDLHARLKAEHVELRSFNKELRAKLETLQRKYDVNCESDATQLRADIRAQHEDIVAMTGRCKVMDEAARAAERKTADIWHISRNALLLAQQAATAELQDQKLEHDAVLAAVRRELSDVTAALQTVQIDSQRSIAAELAAQQVVHRAEMSSLRRQLADATAALEQRTSYAAQSLQVPEC